MAHSPSLLRRLALAALLLAAPMAAAQAAGNSAENGYFFNSGAVPRPVPWQSFDWGGIERPLAGATRVYGGAANGCVAGAVQLPPEGRGYQAIRLSRNRTWGTPQLIRFIQNLGAKAEAAGLNPFLVGDMGQPRGGPMPSGHASHQNGLDVDIWLRLDLPFMNVIQRETLEERSMVVQKPYLARSTDWTEDQATLIRLAAEAPEVERLFVSAGIKRALCEDTPAGDRAWLRKVRPWHYHTGHTHVRLSCPAGQSDCKPGPAIPPGDGCGADLARWLVPPQPPKPAPPAPKVKAPPRRFAVETMPEACAGVLTAP